MLETSFRKSAIGELGAIEDARDAGRHRLGAAYPVGIIGSGFIIDSVALRSYAHAGVNVVAIASRNAGRAASVADHWGIPRSYGDPRQLLDDLEVRVVEIAYPPHLQPDLIRQACEREHVAAILAQKPLALSVGEAREAVDLAAKRGKVLAVNQNMRFDEGIRLAKELIVKGELGKPIFASVEMHAVPHWQPFLRDYGRLTIANMSIHHYDSLRWLLGEPLEVFAAVTKDPRTAFEHVDGLVSSVIKFAGGTLAHSIEDVWVGPADLLTADDASIRWRVTGELGLVEGSCGWPGWPNEVPSTVRYLSQDTQGSWVRPRFATAWFPDAFGAVMCQLQSVLTTGGQLDNSGWDHLGTMAMVEAAYRSIDEARSVKIAEVW